MQEGPGLGAEKAERAAEGKKRQHRVRGATASIVNGLSVGLEDVLVGLIGIKAPGDCYGSRHMLEAVRAHWSPRHLLFSQAVISTACKTAEGQYRC